MYYGARYYDPWVGRFCSQDPELVSSWTGITFNRIRADPQEYNAYSYVTNRPTILVDPSGRQTLLQGLKRIADETVEGGVGAGIDQLGKELGNATGAIAPGGDTVGGPNIPTPSLGDMVEGAAALGDAGPAATGSSNAKGGVGPVNQGKAGVKQSREDAVARGETIVGGEITVETPDGTRSRVDTVTRSPDGTLNFVESKNGPKAKLSPSQKAVRRELNNGGTVTPRGANAEAAGLTPGQSVGGKYRVDQYNPPVQ